LAGTIRGRRGVATTNQADELDERLEEPLFSFRQDLKILARQT